MDINARFETPGSVIERTTELNFFYDIDRMSFRCSLRHPDLDILSQGDKIRITGLSKVTIFLAQYKLKPSKF